MALGVTHICEVCANGADHGPAGIIFTRDATGLGHWVCETHRDAYRAER